MGISIIAGGAFTTVQDKGRIGYQQFGVSVAGVSDRRSFLIANNLVNNDDNDAVLEATLMGPTIKFDKTNIIAITGGNLSPMIDKKPVPMYRAIKVEEGSTLSFGSPKTGCRSYIAFAGGLDVEPIMGSRSTFVKGSIGGVDGRKLDKGDYIGFISPKNNLTNLENRYIQPEDFSTKEYTVRVVMGPQDDAFTPDGIQNFLRSDYVVTNEFDRMGCRLEGNSIKHKETGDIISDGVCFGAVQVPSQGQPIIMMADRQTTGGYTKIANVITVDFTKISQIKPGSKVRFKAVSIEVAQDLYMQELEQINSMKEILNTIQRKDIQNYEPKNFRINVNGSEFNATITEIV